MPHEPTVVEFFAGVGGFGLGLERAGFRTVAFSEIDPFAIAVYRTHWPDAVALGSITDLVPDVVQQPADALRRPDGPAVGEGWTALRADLWTGGFPCQDLSVAGKRAGLGVNPYALNPNDDPDDGPDVARQVETRSGLAFTFLDLVGRHRPRAVLLENVPGLLSSHKGRDLAVLLDRLADLRYGFAWRVLDARWFGVAQRRRRVFILAFDDDAFGGTGEQRAFEVLFEPESGSGDPAAGGEAGAGVAEGTVRSSDGARGPDITGPLDTVFGHHDAERANTINGWDQRHDVGNELVIGPSSDAGRGGTSPGLPGWLDDPLPLGMDSARYRVLGNAVCVNVAEWIGRRLRRHLGG